MQPRAVVCPTCNETFVVTNPRSRQAFCSPKCRPPRKPVDIAVCTCAICHQLFKPTYDCQQYCGDECKWKGFSAKRKVVHEPVSCLTCGVEFVPKRASKKYCSVKCSAARHGTVTKACEVCSTPFTVAYRFREVKTCRHECNNVMISRSLTTRVTKQCLACGRDFSVVLSYEGAAKYCSYDPCFLSSRDTRQPDVEKTCEWCKHLFTVPFTKKEQRFCGYSCANSGENNGQFGLGKEQAWNKVPRWHVGLTKETDPRLRALGEKISVIIADKMVNGTWSPPSTGFKGEHYTGAKNGGKTVYLRSSYESLFARALDADSDVVSWEYEPLRIPYVFEGSVHNYVPDFMVTGDSGLLTLIEVKPECLVDVGKNLAKRRAAEAWCETNGVGLLIVTENELTATSP
jgi:hypothetical protein